MKIYLIVFLNALEARCPWRESTDFEPLSYRRSSVLLIFETEKARWYVTVNFYEALLVYSAKVYLLFV